MMETLGDLESKIFRVNNNICAFSECGEYFAIAYQSNLIIKKATGFDTLRTYAFDDVIEYIEWSPNCQFILCASIKKTIVQIYSIHHPEWKCKLVEGSAGMERVVWAPDSSHIITTADLNVQIAVWSLDEQNVTYIQNMKTLGKNNMAFSPNAKNLAVITTNNGSDSVEIYKTDGWKISRKLLCEKLSAIDGLSWSPNSELLCIWCSISGQAKLLVYSTTSDSHVGAFEPEVPSSLKNAGIQNEEAYYGPRGIDKIAWGPSGQLLALAAFNETIVILNYVTWKPILELRCEPVIKDADYLGRVYRESTTSARSTNLNSGQTEKQTMNEVNERPINIPIATSLNNDVLFIAGFDILVWSSCGSYLALRHQVYSSTMWIWNITEDSVDHVLLKRPISGACWNPTSPCLAIFTESPFIFEWREGSDATKYSAPRGMTVISGRWHPRGKILAVCGYNKTAIMHLGNG